MFGKSQAVGEYARPTRLFDEITIEFAKAYRLPGTLE
jgi:hypothetical protein